MSVELEGRAVRRFLVKKFDIFQRMFVFESVVDFVLFESNLLWSQRITRRLLILDNGLLSDFVPQIWCNLGVQPLLTYTLVVPPVLHPLDDLFCILQSWIFRLNNFIDN